MENNNQQNPQKADTSKNTSSLLYIIFVIIIICIITLIKNYGQQQIRKNVEDEAIQEAMQKVNNQK